MDDNDKQIRAGIKVRTAATLEPWDGLGEGGPNVRQRRPNAVGVVDRDALVWPTRCWYVQHEGDAALTIYREHELTPEPAETPSDGAPKAVMSLDKAQAFLAALDAVEAKRDALAAEIRALGNLLPEGCGGALKNIEVAAEHVQMAAFVSARILAEEVIRPKGPLVTISQRGYNSKQVVTYSSELAEVTSDAIVLRCGYRYSRETGLLLNPERRNPVPYIAREEIDRVVALKMEPVKGAER